MELLTIVVAGMVLLSALLIYLLKLFYSKKVDRLTEEVKLFKNANEYQEEGVVVFSETFEVLSANRSARKMLQLQPYKQGEIAEKEILLQVGKSDVQSLPAIVEKQSGITQGTLHIERALMMIGNTRQHVNIYIDHSTWNRKKSLTCVIQDISHEFKENELMKQFGEVDFLTNLPSQFKANTDINQLVITAQREHKKLAFFLFGINNYSKMKATFGFGYTNSLLKGFADFLQNLESPKSKSYRLDCDNFLHMVEDIQDEEEALETAYALSKSIGAFFESKNRESNLTFPIGVVLFPQHGRNASKLIDHAHIALNNSRKAESVVTLFKSEFNNIQEKERNMVEEMKMGLIEGEFEVYYQPIINLKSAKITAAEALIRWNHPLQGLLTPDKFIRLAKVSGLIIDIGEFVLEQVITQHKKWHDFGFNDIEISVNISARELLNYQLSEKLKELFLREEVDPKLFNLDMSESDAMQDMIKTDYEFSMLKEIGVNLSLDHFGIGGSSVQQLQKLPIHTLKVDRIILKDIDKDQYHQETFKAIVVLAHALNMEVVAEGIETRGQFEMLQKLGCDRAQGHIFAKPAPAFEFQELLRK